MKIFILLLICPVLLLSQEITLNKCSDSIFIKRIFVDVEAINKLAVFDSSSYMQSWKEEYEEFFLKYGFDVISRDKISIVLKEQALQMSGLTKDESLLKTGKLLGADGIFLVRATFFDDSIFTETLKLLSVETGQIVLIARFNNKDDCNNRKPKDLRQQIVFQASKALKITNTKNDKKIPLRQNQK
jgi:hypothetical protein